MIAQRFLNDPRITLNRGGALMIWLIGVYTTSLFLRELGLTPPSCYVLGFGVQGLLTKAQSPLWARKKRTKGAIAALVVDSMLNAAGIWPYMANLGGSTLWTMVSAWMSSANAPEVGTKAVITLLLAVLTAAGPEVLYEQEA